MYLIISFHSQFQVSFHSKIGSWYFIRIKDNNVLQWDFLPCSHVHLYHHGTPAQASLMASDSKNEKSNFRRRWEIKGGADRNGHGTKDSRLLTWPRHCYSRADISQIEEADHSRDKERSTEKLDEMIREQTRPTNRFFPFKVILAVSTAYLFVKPGQMLGEMSEKSFPLYWAIRSWMETTLFPNNSTVSFGPKMYYLLSNCEGRKHTISQLSLFWTQKLNARWITGGRFSCQKAG